MEDIIKEIVDKAMEMKNNPEITDYDIAEFIHIELGKIIYYDNNYSSKLEDNGQETLLSINRKEKMLKETTDRTSKTQICKGMAEIYAEMLRSAGIEAKSVGTKAKGETREVGEDEAKHYYTLFKIGEQEYIQDYLMESALMRIKVGEAKLVEKTPGICFFDDYQEYGQMSLKQIGLSKEYLKNIFGNNIDNLDDNEVFDVLFDKLNEYMKNKNLDFGFEEAKEFIFLTGKYFIKDKSSINYINLVKENENGCGIACIYDIGGRKYLIRGNDEISDIKIPVGQISNEELRQLQIQGYEGRSINDRKYLQLENTKNKRKQEILRKQREFYQGDNEKEDNNGNIHQLDLSNLSDKELQQACFHYSLKKDKNSIDKNGLETRIGRNSKGIDKLSSIYFSYGLEGALETWDVWLKWRANRLYSPYWQEENKDIIEKIENDTATEQEKKEYYYKANLWNEEFSSGKYREDKEKMAFLFDFQIDEMLASNYYLLDLKEGEEFSFDEIDVKKEANLKRKDRPNDIGYKIFQEMYGQYSDFDNAKVDKWNMNTFLGKKITIEPDRIKQLTLQNGKNDVLSIIEYLYDKYKEITPKDEQVKFDLLDSYMEYAKEKIKSSELQHFDRNTRIDENMSISHFHDQKSDGYFEDRTTGVYSTPKYTITPNQIGKKSINAHIGKKDMAKGVVDRKVEERINPQELDPHNHNGSQGGTNDGR